MEEIICWNDTFSVGIAEIDNQHKTLIGMINGLLGFLADDENTHTKNVTGNILEEMISYVDFHFKSEEKYLQQHPDFKAHRFEHWTFAQKTSSFVKDYKDHKAELTDEVCEFLIGWLRLHILESDRKDFQYLLENNLLQTKDATAFMNSF